MSVALTRKEEILQVAQTLFREHGYASTSVRDIARALDIEAASLYSHISTKEDLLSQTCFGLADQFLAAIHEVNDIYFNAEEKLRMAIRLHVEILTSNLNAAIIFNRDWRSLGEENKTRFIALRNEYEAGIRAIIQNGIDEGLFNESDLQFASLCVLSSVNWITEWYKSEGALNPRQIADKLSDFILTGLKKNNIH